MSTQKGHASGLKPGRYFMVGDEPCKVVSVDVSKSGKHGHAKARIVCIGLFDNNKRSLTYPSHASVDLPIIEKNTALVSALMGETVMLTDNDSFETFEIPMPVDEEIKVKIIEGATVEYWDVMNKKIIMNVKGSK